MAEQKKALVTGASRGIGAAIFTRLAADGFAVAGTATSNKGLDSITQVAGEAFQYNAEQPDAAKNLAKGTGDVDVLVCNAGITRDGLSMRMDDQTWQSVIDTNLSAPFTLVRQYMRGMMKARYGRIVLISSVVASSGNPGQANYAAAKAGLEGMARSLARELATRNITVNAVAPGFIATDMTKGLVESEHGEKTLAQIPLGRLGTPEEIAASVAFLCSEQAGYITGITLPVNGGMLMG